MMPPRKIPSRVVSLVPSLTESVFDLGLGEHLVGVTDYCVHPLAKTQALPSVGGPGDAHLEDILALQPDLVLAGQEENEPDLIHELQRAGVQVFLAFPLTAMEAVNTLLDLASLFQHEEGILRAKTLQVTVEWQAASAANRTPVRIFCPLWTASLADSTPWWMTFNQQTYASSVLSLFAGVNAFGARRRRYPIEADLGLRVAEEPAGRDTRYPRISGEEIRACQADIVIFPSEPYAFTDEEIAKFCSDYPDLPAVHSGRIYMVDGSLLFWYGTRLALALEELGSLFDM